MTTTTTTTKRPHPTRPAKGAPQAAALGLLLLLAACASDWRDGIAPAQPQHAVGFTSTVVGSQQATRADGSVLDVGQTTLPETKKRTIYRANSAGTVEAQEREYQVGLFGAHTGQYTWAQLVQAKAVADNGGTPMTSDQQDCYWANIMFNLPANVMADGSLSYTPLYFWPNDNTNCTFWAYYPYNATSTSSTYGINITEANNGRGMGMGRVHFTMQTDAALQTDFMISAPATDRNHDSQPLVEQPQGTYEPRAVPLRFYHMLAQVRLYAFCRGTDAMVYQKDTDGNDLRANEAWLDGLSDGTHTIIDPWGNGYTISKSGTEFTITNDTLQASFPADDCNLTKEAFVKLGLYVPDETQTERWNRHGGTWDLNHRRRRANLRYKMEFVNVRTEATFFPRYSSGSATIDYEPGNTLGTITVNHFIMNPYWFRFSKGERYMLNDNYLWGDFEDTPGFKGENSDYDGMDWSQYQNYSGSKSNALRYELNNENATEDGNHYNYPPGNILLVVPQSLDDDDVPHVVITATGESRINGVATPNRTGKITINMLNMNIVWQPGYIYSYAFIDNDLHPGDDKVKGPESITPTFRPTTPGEQW